MSTKPVVVLQKPSCQGRLLLGFDCTYLTSTLSQLQMHGKRGMVGGTFSLGNPEKNNAFCELNEELDCTAIRKSGSMLEFLMWCPSSKQKCPLSVCELPVEHHFGGPHAEFRGNLYMLEIVGSVLEKANGCVAGLVFDAHGTHSYLKRLLHGQLEGLPQEATQAPWFKTLTFKQLPENDLPRLPISVAHFQDQPVWAIPGICNLLDKKSFVEQLGFVDNGIVAFLNLFFSWFWHVYKNGFCRANVFYLMELLIECCCFFVYKKHGSTSVQSFPFWGHANKNSGAQILSYIRTVFYGDFWVDVTGSRTYGLPPAVLARESPMSDKAQALLSNPWFLISNAESCLYDQHFRIIVGQDQGFL